MPESLHQVRSNSISFQAFRRFQILVVFATDVVHARMTVLDPRSPRVREPLIQVVWSFWIRTTRRWSGWVKPALPMQSRSSVVRW